MKRYLVGGIAAIVFVVMPYMHGSSCRKIEHGTRVESFVQRFSCAKRAIQAGKVVEAYDLMAPIYQNALGATGVVQSQSRAKLRKVVELQLPAVGAQLIKQYSEEEVYAALTQAANIDPATGQTATQKQVLPVALETSVANALQSTRISKPVSKPAPTKPAPARPEARPAARPMPQEPEPQELVLQERELTPEEARIVEQVERQPVKLFALNHILDEIFFHALLLRDTDVCQNLTSAIVSEKEGDIQAIKDIIQTYNKNGGDVSKVYKIVKENMGSYAITKMLTATKDPQKLFNHWIDTTPALPLVNALQEIGVPSEQQEKTAGAYLLNQTSGNDGLRRSRVIMLIRTCKGLLFEPEGGTVALPTPSLMFGKISDFQKVLRDTIIANKYVIQVDTTFDVGDKRYTVEELDEQIAKFMNALIFQEKLQG